MGPNILSEAVADAEVIKSLERHIAKLKGKHYMSRIILFKDLDGSIKRAHSFEPVTREDIIASIDQLKALQADSEAALAEFDQLVAENIATAEASEPTEPTTEAPVEEPAPVETVEAPAPEVAPELQPTQIPVDTSTTDLTQVPTDAPAPVAEPAPVEPVATTEPAVAPVAPEVIQ